MGYFSAPVVGIFDIGNRVCKLYDGESNNDTLIEIESFYRIQVQTNNEHKRTRSDDDGDYDDDRDDDFNRKSEISSSDST